MTTNGKQPAIDRETVIREATYYAALFGWYDTSKAAQQPDPRREVTISLLGRMAEYAVYALE